MILTCSHQQEEAAVHLGVDLWAQAQDRALDLAL